jgi:NRPS condensation-like uncharacterized protein
MNKWYKLDNAAKLFPAVSNHKNTSVFRVAAILNEKIDGAVLQRAADHIFSRFPMLFVRMQSGVFWNYIDENEKSFRVRQETTLPCAELDPRENNGYMLRVLFGNNRISVECFHSLTDGGGAFEFLKSLTYYYLQFSGKEFSHHDFILTAGNGAGIDETEDSYQRHYKKMPRKEPRRQNAYGIRGTRFHPYGNNVTTGIMSVEGLKKLAKGHEATITAYLSAVMAYAIMEAHLKSREDKRPIIISVPVNLRKIFLSDTLRNFFCVADLVCEQKSNVVFSALVKEMTAQLREKTTKENLQAVISRNLNMERYAVSKAVPLLLKRLILAIGFDILGDRKRTLTFSNLGNVSIPPEMAEHICWFEANIYTSGRNPVMCTSCSVGDKMAVSFSRTIAETDVIRRFFTFLANEGLAVSIYSNDFGV